MIFCTSDFISNQSIGSLKNFLVDDPSQRHVGHPCCTMISLFEWAYSFVWFATWSHNTAALAIVTAH